MSNLKKDEHVFSTYNFQNDIFGKIYQYTYSIKIAFYGVWVQFMGCFGYIFLTVVIDKIDNS